jgi:hypothetical protein
MAQVVLEAFRVKESKRRYAIGHMWRAAAFLESHPQPVADAILKQQF